MNESRDVRFEYMTILMREFRSQSDRVVAILTGSYLEALLKDLLTAKVKMEPDLVESLLFKNLQSFRYKIDTVYSRKVGLITEDERRDLHKIRKIRNQFAHRFVDLSFDSNDIRQMCYALRLSEIGEQPKTPRDCFIKAAVRLMVELSARILDLRDEEKE
jgi:hypothetical protein